MSGIQGQLGYKSETTNGTAVTVDAFLPVNSVGVNKQITRLPSAGIRAGRRAQHTWAAGAQTIGGTVAMELWNVDVAAIFKHMFGAVSTTGSGPYTHTFTPGDLNNDSMTVQAGKPGTGGTVHPFTWAGCKVASWEISSDVDAIAMLSLELSAQTETTATALATASYDSALAPFTFIHGSLTVAGSAVATVRSVSLSGNNNLATDRHRFGSATVLEQLENGGREYGGQFEADFEDLTHYNRYVDGDEFALVLAFDNGTDSLTITMNVRYDGSSPELAGPELLSITLPFTCVSATSDAAAITAVLVNTDASAA